MRVNLGTIKFSEVSDIVDKINNYCFMNCLNRIPIKFYMEGYEWYIECLSTIEDFDILKGILNINLVNYCVG